LKSLLVQAAKTLVYRGHSARISLNSLSLSSGGFNLTVDAPAQFRVPLEQGFFVKLKHQGRHSVLVRLLQFLDLVPQDVTIGLLLRHVRPGQ
jgi:hypothetical protein